jgi:hypothetical protein
MQQQQFEHQKKENLDTIPFYYSNWFILGLIVCLLSMGYLWDNYMSQSVIVTTTKVISVSKPSAQNSSDIKFAKIQDVQVGERAIGKNPELTDSERSTFLPDPESATWRKLTLEMIKPDGKRLDITLLRPLSWIKESNAQISATIFLALPEMGAQGLAKVLNIESCPPIKKGRGNVITGTFHHEAANTIDLYVEGLAKPIGCTDNHPFWSVTRNEFIEAGKLLRGEQLQLHNGQTAKVIQILPRPGPERVHNLEVMNEHVYRVTNEGILVHNTCNYSKPVSKFGVPVRTNVTNRGQKKVDYLFNEKNDADNWAAKTLGPTKQRIYNEHGWCGWRNDKGETVYWNHGDWDTGPGVSAYPHLNYEVGGVKGHLFLQDKIISHGLMENFQNEFGN